MVKRKLLMVSVLLGALATALGASGASAGTDMQPANPAAALGPNGEVPSPGVSDDEVRLFAETSGLSLSDARFALFDGSRIAADFVADHKDDPAFGAFRVDTDGELRYVLRTTSIETDLPRLLSQQLDGRALKVVAGGLSAAETESLMEQSFAKTRAAMPNAPIEVSSDFATGDVVLRLNPADVADRAGFVADVGPNVRVVFDASLRPEQPASYAGVAREPTCTIGIPLTGDLTGNPALMTAAHCSDSGTTAYGYSLGNAFHEQCYGSDRQLHSTTANYLWHGFFNIFDQWTNIYDVAGGYYVGQTFQRIGKMGDGYGTVPALTWGTGNSPSECGGVYDIHGFVLDNNFGSPIVGGDSGGPVLLAYDGKWFFAATASTEGPSGSDGRAGWRSLPNHWTACTVQTPCGSV